MREPLFVRWPGVVPSGTICREMVTSVDFFPTIAQIVGSKTPTSNDAEMDGVGLLPLLRQAGTLDRDALYWHYPHYHPIGGDPYRAIREGDWKLIEFYEDDHLELYNVTEDIGESKDLAAAKPELAARLREKLHRWLQSVDAQMPRPNPDHPP